MKKVVIAFFTFVFAVSSCFAFTDRYSKEYLQSKKHLSVINPIFERAVENMLKKELKKETGANCKVSFKGYTTSSIKKGIFKKLELSGNNLKVSGIPLEYAHLKTLTDYNYIDYKKSPIVYKSDMEFAYDIILTEEAINIALDNKKYQNVIARINKMAYPMFCIDKVRTKIIKNKMYLIIDYNFPIGRSNRERTFVTSSDLRVEKGKIYASNVHIDSIYGNLGLDRVANLINLLNPLEFTLNLMDSKNCKGNVENVNIVDNKIKVDGKMFVSGEKS